MRAFVLAVLLSVLALNPPVLAGDGYVGVYSGDGLSFRGIYEEGTASSCIVLPYGVGTTLYVVARLEGASVGGISGAEFRIEVSNPTGYSLFYSMSHFEADRFGGNCADILDLEPGKPAHPAGTRLTFPCDAGRGGVKIIGTIQVFNASGGATTFCVRGRSPSSDVSGSGPYFVLCGDGDSTRVRMSPAPDSSCAKRRSTVLATKDGAIFTAELNVDDRVTGTPATLIKRLQFQFHQPICFIQSPGERQITVRFARPVVDIIDQIVEEDSTYEVAWISGHRVVYPHDSPFQRQVTLPDSVANGAPRWTAWRDYIYWLNRNIPGCEDLKAPAYFRSGPRDVSPREDRVVLERQATILEHLSALIPSDTTAVFIMNTGTTGWKYLNFPRVGTGLVLRR
jgi:hypothetical protein